MGLALRVPARVCPGSQLPTPSPPSPTPTGLPGSRFGGAASQGRGCSSVAPPGEVLLPGPVTPRRGPSACPRSARTPPLGDWPAQGGGCWPGFCCLTQTRCGGWGRGAGFPGGPVPRLPAPLGRAPPPDPPPAHWAGTGALTPGLAVPLLARPPWVHGFPPLASSSLARPAPTLGVGGEAEGVGSAFCRLPASPG